MNAWKIGSRWSEHGSDNSVLEIFRKYSIIFIGKETEKMYEIKKGDLIAVSDGKTVVSIGIATELAKPITKFNIDGYKKELSEYDVEYADWVIGIKVILFKLSKKHEFAYKKIGTIYKTDTYKPELEKIISENFIYPSKNIFSGKQKKYALKQIRIQNYQSISDIVIKNIPTDTQWIFLTGENGYGKTSVLQAIVIGLFGNKDGNYILDQKEKIKCVTELKNKNNPHHINFSKNKYITKFEHFVAYGTSRLNKSSKPINNTRTYSLFNTYSELLDIEDRLIMWEKDKSQAKYFNSAVDILKQLMSPYISDIIVERSGPSLRIKYKEYASNELKNFNELASGFKSIISMIGDLVIRLSETQPEITNYNELSGIVIIDEFDMHLHPKMQKELVERLSNIFKNIQFIISSHSPIPFLGAPENSVFIKIDRDGINGITAEKLDIEVQKLTPNSILTSPIFGFDDINSTEADIDEIETADRYSNIVKDKSLKEKLNILKQNDEDFFNDLIATKK